MSAPGVLGAKRELPGDSAAAAPTKKVKADSDSPSKEAAVAAVAQAAVNESAPASTSSPPPTHPAAADASTAATANPPAAAPATAPASLPAESSADSGTVASAAEASAEASAEANAATGKFVSRDESAKQEEDGGTLSFRVITNDGDANHMKHLITLKNIFSRQLPKMPKEYIVRLVMDRRHHSMALYKEETVVGGICFRPFADQ